MTPEFVPPPDALTVPAKDTNLDPDSTRSGDHQAEGAGVDPWATVTPGAAGPRPFSSGSPVLPCRFGSYLLEEEIAAGGMGVVYKAQQVLGEGDPPRTRRVALKMILPEKLRSGDAVGRFEDEAHFAANLEHPNIVPIYEVGKLDGQPFFSMQYVEGGNLEQLVDDPQAPRPRQAARLVQQLAEAVQYAHDRGVVHRDIKPSNILLTVDGGARLSDLGLSHTLTPGVTVTGMGSIGSVEYYDPDMLRGEQPGPHHDVWSLGAVLHRVSCGAGLYGDLPADDGLLALRRILTGEPSISPNLPPALADIVRDCLAPVARRLSAEALAERLSALSATGVPS
jgi:serine/threonine protein kinase